MYNSTDFADFKGLYLPKDNQGLSIVFPGDGKVEFLGQSSDFNPGITTSVQAVPDSESYKGVTMPRTDDLFNCELDGLSDDDKDSSIDQSEPLRIVVEAQVHASDLNSSGPVNDPITNDIRDLGVIRENLTETDLISGIVETCGETRPLRTGSTAYPPKTKGFFPYPAQTL